MIKLKLMFCQITASDHNYDFENTVFNSLYALIMKRLAEDKRVRRIYSDSASESDSDHSSVKRDKKEASVIMPKAATAGNSPNELNWSNSSVVRVFPHHYIYVRDLTTNVTRLEVGPQTFVRKDNEQVSLRIKHHIY